MAEVSSTHVHMICRNQVAIAINI